MLVKGFRERFISSLEPIYGLAEAEHFFYMLLEEYLSMKRVDLALCPAKEMDEATVSAFEHAFAQLQNQVPIQYILGKAAFYGLELEVNPSVLVPRPETEELVDWIVKDYEFKGSPKIIDIGTGSGCIPIALKANLADAQVFALDVSAEALEVAARNASKNGVSVNFAQQDILATADLGQLFDIIVSNPPYVRELEKAEMRKNVLDHEPHLALFVADEDALVFYRKIAAIAESNLSEHGKLYFEINQYLAKETIEMLRANGFSQIELRQDLYGNDRMIKASRA